MIAVVQSGEVISWNYSSTVTSEFTPQSGEINFDALPANLEITISGTSEIRIIKFKDSDGNFVDELTTYTSGGVNNTVSTRAPAGTYTVEVLRSSRQSSTGTSSPVTVDDSLSSVSVDVN
jgi:hypothetical protein